MKEVSLRRLLCLKGRLLVEFEKKNEEEIESSSFVKNKIKIARAKH